MAYIGNTPAEKYVSLTAQHFTVTATASYVLTSSVTNENGIALFINNVRQQPGASYAYTAAGTTLTLSAATAATDTMYCVYLGKAVGTIAPPDGSVNSAKIVDGSITSDDLAGSIANAKITDLAGNKLTGTVTAKGDGASAVGKLLINCEQNTHGVTIQSPVHSSGGNYTLTLPINDGDANDFLQSNGSGVLSWTAVPPTDTSQLEMNQALLAFKIAASNQLAKFQMVDQVIDEYQDATGIDAGNSTNENVGGATTAKYYEGATGSDPTGGASVDTSVTGYKTHVFTGDASLTVTTPGNVDILVVAGGGSGGNDYGGGGGAGGLIYKATHALTANTYDAVIGNGGAAKTSGGLGNNGVDSTWTINGGAVEFTAKGGGAGGISTVNAGIGGSGGGGGHAHSGYSGNAANQGSQSGDSGTYGFGFAGGDGTGASSYDTGGGGGAGSVGQNAPSSGSGNGGTGKDMSAIFGTAVGESGWFASGGGGGATTDGNAVAGTASNGGGSAGGISGAASATGQANTGGGSGGGGNYGGTGNASGAGGTGVILVRYATSAFMAAGQNLTLQSVATTAASAPTTGDLVVLVDDGGSGTSAVQTNIKGFISRNGNFATLDTDHKQVTFVDEGTWGTTKQKILVARNVDLSGITTGTSMKYRLTTHSQSAGTMETRIHATSLAWA
tara:strand:- start:68 stop:2086 length:2019 start_codon:yes stop_codon:yes gene_type:complete